MRHRWISHPTLPALARTHSAWTALLWFLGSGGDRWPWACQRVVRSLGGTCSERWRDRDCQPHALPGLTDLQAPKSCSPFPEPPQCRYQSQVGRDAGRDGVVFRQARRCGSQHYGRALGCSVIDRQPANRRQSKCRDDALAAYDDGIAGTVRTGCRRSFGGVDVTGGKAVARAPEVAAAGGSKSREFARLPQLGIAGPPPLQPPRTIPRAAIPSNLDRRKSANTRKDRWCSSSPASRRQR